MHSSRMRAVCCSGRFGEGAGGVCPGGVSAGGVCPGEGVCLLGGRGCTPPPVDRITDACENITFQQLLLRMVIRNNTEEIIDILSLLCYVDVNRNGEYLLTISTGNCIT